MSQRREIPASVQSTHGRRVDRQAEVVARWAGDKAMYAGADLLPEVVAHVCGWIHIHRGSTRWLRARESPH